MFRRHPIVMCCLLLLLAGGIACGIFLARFDLDHYRSDLQQTFGEALGCPVVLGKTRLSWNQGPALSFADITIGPTVDQTLQISAKHLLLRLDPHALWQKQLKFTEIVLLEPRLILQRVGNTPDEDKADTAVAPTAIPLAKTLVHDLSLRNGSLLIRDLRDDASILLEITEINARLRGLALNQPIGFELSGKVMGDASTTLEMSGQLSPISAAQAWRDCRIDLNFTARDLAPAFWLRRYAPAAWGRYLAGKTALQGRVSGALNSGLAVKFQSNSDDLALYPTGKSDLAWPLNHVALSGTLSQTGGRLGFNDFRLAADDLHVSGTMALDKTTEIPLFSLALNGLPLPLEKIRRHWPWPKAFSLGPQPANAAVRIMSAELNLPLHGTRDLRTMLAALQARLLLQNVRWQPEKTPPLQDISATVTWNGKRLDLTDGRFSFEALSSEFSGFLETPWDKDFPLGLELTGALQSRTILDWVPKKIDGLKITGPVSCRLTLSGSREDLSADLTTDLTAVAVRYQDAELKAQDRPGSLTLSAELTPPSWRLRQGELQLTPISVRAQGELTRDEKRLYSLAVLATVTDLEACQKFHPLLRRLALKGQLLLDYRLTGAEGKISQQRGVLTLSQVGAHLTRTIADVNGAAGRILLFPDHIESQDLTLKLGGSPLEVKARIADLKDPTIDIQVRGESVRADDVIFHNDQIFLRQLNGHLRINRDGIYFDPVRVRLDGGTEAIVNGSVTDFAEPTVNLDIEASYGNIDEVIALWRRPENAPPPEPREKSRTRLLITARAHQGQLGDLRFQEAQGDITLRNGILSIFPLHFQVAEGRCRAQVAVDSSRETSSFLKISGHLDNFDASAIYTDLLHRKGLVTGILTGDFYLEGIAGKEFLDSSHGGFFFEVKDGVLRKFTFLAKVFSILNVSQILTLQLPDMDTQGMPFSRLRATARLDQGVLSSNDLVVDSTSMNLSLIGDYDIRKENLDLVLGVKPLRTVDQILTKIPLAGWLLTGSEKALITAHFSIKGKSTDPEVVPIPITSVSEKVLGIFKRVFGLPNKLVTDPGGLLK